MTTSPFGPRVSKSVPLLRTSKRDGISTMPLKRQRMRRTRAGSIFSRDTDKASVAVPCRMMSGRPAALACATSVWIGLKMRAHSV